MEPTIGHVPAEGLLEDEEWLLTALKRGEERAYVLAFKQYHRALVRLALSYGKRDEVAEEVAQEAWQGLFESLPRFPPEASLRTWLYRILINRARARQRDELRNGSAASAESHGEDSPAVPAARFRTEGHPWAGHWASPPRSFALADPALSAESRGLLVSAIEALPESQREVMALRDVEGLSSEQVCNVLGLSDLNQRLLLHRARARVRAYLEERLGAG